jgi:hypothetical protein
MQVYAKQGLMADEFLKREVCVKVRGCMGGSLRLFYHHFFAYRRIITGRVGLLELIVCH